MASRSESCAGVVGVKMLHGGLCYSREEVQAALQAPQEQAQAADAGGEVFMFGGGPQSMLRPHYKTLPCVFLFSAHHRRCAQQSNAATVSSNTRHTGIRPRYMQTLNAVLPGTSQPSLTCGLQADACFRSAGAAGGNGAAATEAVS